MPVMKRSFSGRDVPIREATSWKDKTFSRREGNYFKKIAKIISEGRKIFWREERLLEGNLNSFRKAKKYLGERSCSGLSCRDKVAVRAKVWTRMQ